MKKEITTQLRDLAGKLPETWERTHDEHTVYSGKDLNLAFVGGKKQYDDNKHYEVSFPVLRQVNHYERLKNGVKKYGLKFIVEYTKGVINAGNN